MENSLWDCRVCRNSNWKLGFTIRALCPRYKNSVLDIFDKFRAKLRLGALLSPFQAGEQHLPAGLHEFLII